MRIAYYADDGTEFETQGQCEAYEKEQENVRNNFTSHMYDDDGEEISLKEIMEGDDYNYTIDYFDIKTDEDLQLIQDMLYEQCGMTVPTSVGQWYYNYEKDCWCSYEDYKGLYLFMSEIFEGK